MLCHSTNVADSFIGRSAFPASRTPWSLDRDLFVVTSRDEERRQTELLGQLQSFYRPQNHQGCGPAIGRHWIGIDHGDRQQCVLDGGSGARVNNVRIGPSADLELLPCCAGCRDRVLVQIDLGDEPRCAQRVSDSHSPGGVPDCQRLAADFDECVVDTRGSKQLSQLPQSITLDQGIQVQLDIGINLADFAAVLGDTKLIDAAALPGRIDRGWGGWLPVSRELPKLPESGQRADCGIERTS